MSWNEYDTFPTEKPRKKNGKSEIQPPQEINIEVEVCNLRGHKFQVLNLDTLSFSQTEREVTVTAFCTSCGKIVERSEIFRRELRIAR